MLERVGRGEKVLMDIRTLHLILAKRPRHDGLWILNAILFSEVDWFML